MKQTKITAFLALAFILGVAAPVAGITIANTVAAAEQAAATIVSTEAELRNAITNGSSSIALNGNITLTSTLTIAQAGILTINLNGYSITNPSGSAMQINQGNVTITGTGTVEAGSGSTITLVGAQTSASNYTALTVGTGVTVKSNTMYGVTVSDLNKSGKSYGVTLNFNGTMIAPYGITVNGRIQDATNAPKIIIGDGAKFTTRTAASVQDNDGTPIYAAGYANWVVGAATMDSEAAIAMKAGVLTFNGTKVTVDGVATNPGVTSGGIDGNNSVFQIEHNVKYADQIELTINGGSYVSKNGDVFYEYNLDTTKQVAADVDINGGTFTAAAGKAVFGGDVEDLNVQITSGTFSGSDVASFKANGYLAGNLDLNENGVVVKPATSGSSSSTATISKLVSADGAVTVQGNLGGATTLKVEPVERKISAFGSYKNAIYDLTLLDANGNKVELTEPVSVSILVPTVIDGAKSRIYSINEADAVEQVESYYVNGVINFTATHFSLYAIVENSDSIIAGTDNQVPNTGIVSGQGIINAISTTLPLMVLAGVAFVWFNRHMVKVRRAERTAEAERERIIKAYIPKAKKEATIDHFVATPVEHHNPDGPMVDMFIANNK